MRVLVVAGIAARTTGGGPWSFHPHPIVWAAVAVLAGGYALALGRRRTWSGAPANPRQWGFFAGGLLALALALTWPLADLAAQWSLTALIGQRLLLTLAAAPLLLLGLPAPVIARFTRPAPVDAALEFLTRPVVAVVTVTAVALATLTPAAVAAQSSSAWARAAIDVLLLATGMILWGPVLGHIPGARRASGLGTAVYLFVQSLLPTFPAVIYIFSNHSLYPALAGAHQVLGMSSVGDQHLAGVVAKLATLPVLWTVAWVVLVRAQSAETGARDPYPLTWAEVERQLQRAERAERARGRHRRRRPHLRGIPRPIAGGWVGAGGSVAEGRPPTERRRDDTGSQGTGESPSTG